MIPSIRNPYIEQIERLEEELEAMRQRAEAAEFALAGVAFDQLVPPLTLQMTRIMRILAKHDISSVALAGALSAYYPNTSDNCIKAQLSRIRGLLPEHIAPPRRVLTGWGVSSVHTIPDRAALVEFLETGVLPTDLRRAA